jgi:hypothetical protein
MHSFQAAMLILVVLAAQGGSRCLAQEAGQAPVPGSAQSRLRTDNQRISEALAYAIRQAPSFADLVTTLEASDRIVYIEEGRCGRPNVRACLNLMSGHQAKILVVRLDSRQTIRCVVAQLAHELHHALEIAREPEVVDVQTLERLYERIGELSCSSGSDRCHETRAAQAFEALVTRQLSSGSGLASLSGR